MALYEPGLGYYSAGLHKLGEGGDFVTAPELGTLFAACIARQIEEVAGSLGSYDILEIGAGTGKLALDVLSHLPGELQPRRYLILERSADLVSVQKNLISSSLPGWQDRVKWLSAPPDEAWRGVILANEVVDAMAVERFRLGKQGIEQAGISTGDSGFSWRFRPAPPELEQSVWQLHLDTGGVYVSELNLHLNEWLQSVTRTLEQGVALLVDYGYPRSEYYRPARADGTLMCHYRHHAHDDVFFWPGLQDITSFVDFTALAEAADHCELEVSGYTSQAMFLLSCGLDQVLTARSKLPGQDMQILNQEARKLTLPDSMGERFQVMALTRNFETDLLGFSLRDLRHRL
jgi:SAM-dependent MidA family methyltransferase